jgi:hypothetical protein
MMTTFTGAGILIGATTTVGIRAVYLFSHDPGRRRRAWRLLTLHRRHH